MIIHPNWQYIFFLFLNAGMSINGMAQIDTMTRFGVSHNQELEYQKWVENLYEMGVKIEGDSVYITEEARKVATDSIYRLFIYREKYNWAEANYLFKQMQYKIAFWHLINIYADDPASRENVLKYILSFEKAFQMDKVLLSVFYTYALLDPKVATIVNGKPDIHHPEIVEQKLNVVREIVGYILTYRSEQKR